ncbi:MAG: ruvX [Holophagaceae bacterium]|nr:ruvX [Holophagaceae bacterium]
MRWMALDHGTKKIGIAFSDELEILASPFEVWPQQDDLTLQKLARLARAEGVQALLVGLPRHKDGNESETAPLARAFGEAIRDLTGLPLVFWDERLTSVEAERLLAQRGVKPKDRKAKLDAAAAAVMLHDLIEDRRSRRIPADRLD